MTTAPAEPTTDIAVFKEIVAGVTPKHPTCEAHEGLSLFGAPCGRPATHRAWHPDHGDGSPCAHLICPSHAWQYADRILHLQLCPALHDPDHCVRCKHVVNHNDWTIAHL